jgi:hypothetical protein
MCCMPKPSSRYGLLCLGVTTAVLSVLGPLHWSLGVAGAATAVAATVWQHRTSRTPRIEVTADMWAKTPTGAYEYRVAPAQLGGRASAATFMPLEGGGEEEVITDVRRMSDGSLRVLVAAPTNLILYLR